MTPLPPRGEDTGGGTCVEVGRFVSLGMGLAARVGGSVGEVISVLAAVGGIAGSSVDVGVVLVVVQAVKSMIRTIIEMKNLE